MAQQRSKTILRRTPLDGALAVFLFTAALGVWAAYDRQAAWAKFGLLAAGIAIYYWIAWQPARRLPLASHFLAVTAAALAGYFLLTHDWNALPADIGALNRLGVWWMGMRPQVHLAPMHPNLAGGLIAALAPLMLFSAWHAWRERRMGLSLVMAGIGGLAALGLLMTSSRAAWLVLALALVVWLIWQVAPRLSLRLPVGTLLLAGVTLAVLLAWLAWPRLPQLFRLIPGAPTAGSRLELGLYTLRLVGDYPFTGGGLAAFAGLYSYYIKIIPHFLYGYAHNLYLDIAVEQGLTGLAAWLVIWVASLRMLLRAGDEAGLMLRALRGALLAGLLVMGLHGLVDDAFYGMGGTPLLFAIPGLAVASCGVKTVGTPAGRHAQPDSKKLMRMVFAALAVVALATTVLGRQPLLGAWYANLGAVEMARVDLRDYPSGEWAGAGTLPLLAPAQALLQQSLQHQPGNVTANFRLGLIAMQRRDYEEARLRLEIAMAGDPGHRGVQKALGFTYAWTGAFEQALPLLQEFPETGDELEAYITWWRAQGRADLAGRAEVMLSLLSSRGM